MGTRKTGKLGIKKESERKREKGKEKGEGHAL